MRKLFLIISLIGISALLFGWGEDIRLKTPSSGIRKNVPGSGVAGSSSNNTTTSSYLYPYFSDGVSLGNLTYPSWTENSGIVRTQKAANDGYLWSIDDGIVNPPQMRAIQISTAGNGGAWTFTGAVGVDIEDIASVTVGTTSWVYVTDCGDNANTRSTFNVFRTREPTITGSNGTLSAGSDYETIVCTFPAVGVPSLRDIECAFSDPANGDLYFITKRITPIKFFSLTYSSIAYVGTQTLTYGGTTYAMAFSTQATGSNNGNVTGCDMSPSGLELVVKNYNDMYLFQRASTSTSILTLLQSTPTYVAGYVGANRPSSHPNNEPQGEAVAFSSDAQYLYTASEDVAAFGTSATSYPLLQYARLSSSYTSVSFQDGVASYAGTQDTYLYSLNASSAAVRGSEVTFVLDWNATSPTDERQSLLKFDISSIPSTATIVGVDLFLTITTEGSSFQVFTMYDVWFETDTYALKGAFPLRNDVQAASVASARHMGYATLTGQIQINIPNSVVQAWVNGSVVNNGWLLYSDDIPGGNGFQMGSRENVTITNRPRLVIRYI